MSLLTLTHFEYLCTLLVDLDEKSVRYKLVEGVFRIDGKHPNATPELKKWIGHHREGLTFALCRQQNLCMVCKKRRSTRPYNSLPDGFKDWCESCWRKQIAWYTDTVKFTMLGETKKQKQDKQAEEEQENGDLCLSLI